MEQDELNRIDHLRHLYREHIENCAVFAKDLLRGAFVINGAAVTAILASENFYTLKWPSFIFALGAFLAIMAGFFAYKYQYNIAFTFKRYITKDEKDLPRSGYDYEKHRPTAVNLGLASLVSFFVGLIVCGCILG